MQQAFKKATFQQARLAEILWSRGKKLIPQWRKKNFYLVQMVI
jgi:hypothetical protein